MKREDLKALGLTDEQIEKVMGMHGTTVTDLQTKLAAATVKTTDAETQLTKLNTDLTAAQKSGADAEALKSQLADAQKALAATQKTQKVRDALTAYKPRDASTLIRLLDLDKVSFTDAGAVGLKEQVDALKAAQGYLFADEPTPKGGGDPNPNPNPTDFSARIKAAQEAGNRPLLAALIRQQAEAAQTKKE